MASNHEGLDLPRPCSEQLSTRSTMARRHAFVLRYATYSDTLRKVTANFPMITAKSLSSVLDAAERTGKLNLRTEEIRAALPGVTLRQPCASNLHTLRDDLLAFLRVRLLAFSYYVEHSIVDGGQLRLFAGVIGRFLYDRFDLF